MTRLLAALTIMLPVLVACDDSDRAETQFLEHHKESVEKAREVEDRVQDAQDRRREMLEDLETHEP